MSSRSKALAAAAPLTLISGLGAAEARAARWRPSPPAVAARDLPVPSSTSPPAPVTGGHQPAQTGPDEPVEPTGIPPGQSPRPYAIQTTLILAGWLCAVLLCAARGRAMWLLDLSSRQGRRSALRILEGTLAAGFVTMFVLRLHYLQVTGVAGFWPGAIEALVLTAVSAVLVAVGLPSARAGRRADPQDTATAGGRASLSVLAVGCANPGSSRTVLRRAPSRAGDRIVQPGWTG
jgi:hypothetical protein